MRSIWKTLFVLLFVASCKKKDNIPVPTGFIYPEGPTALFVKPENESQISTWDHNEPFKIYNHISRIDSIVDRSQIPAVGYVESAGEGYSVKMYLDEEEVELTAVVDRFDPLSGKYTKIFIPAKIGLLESKSSMTVKAVFQTPTGPVIQTKASSYEVLRHDLFYNNFGNTIAQAKASIEKWCFPDSWRDAQNGTAALVFNLKSIFSGSSVLFEFDGGKLSKISEIVGGTSLISAIRTSQKIGIPPQNIPPGTVDVEGPVVWTYNGIDFQLKKIASNQVALEMTKATGK